MDVVKSLQDTKRYFGVIHSSKCKAYVEQICIVDSCNFSRRKVNRPKQYRKINYNRYVTKHSNRDLLDLLESELNLNIFVVFEGKANEIYSAVG